MNENSSITYPGTAATFINGNPSTRPSEFDSESGQLMSTINALNEMLKTLEGRLRVVSRNPLPVEDSAMKSVGPNTALGQFIRKQTDDVMKANNVIGDILERLEI